MNKLTLEERIEKLEKNNVQYEAFINLAKYLMDDKSKIRVFSVLHKDSATCNC